MDLKAVLSWIRNKFTILIWISDYTKDEFTADTKAGLTIGVIVIPQVMAYAVIAGLSPIYGLYGSLIPLLIYPLFGTSRHLSLGVVATDMIIIVSGASNIAEPGTSGYVSVVILLTMFAGLVHIALSLLRMGFLVNLLSKPVIFGFTAAAPLIIGFSQLGNILGIDTENSQYVGILLIDLIEKIESVNIVALAIGLTGFLMLYLLKKWKPMFPRALVLLVSSGLVVWGFKLQLYNLDLIGPIPSGLPSFEFPDISLENFRRLIPTVTTLVVVQLMTVISLGKTYASKYKYPINPNREFFAIGAANFVGSFFQSPPISGSFSRTVVSEQAGTKTTLSNVVCAAVICLTLLFLTPLFYYIPIAALSSIIILAVLSLIDIDELKYFFRTKPEDGYIAIFTFFSVLFIGIQEGILLGIGGSLLMVLYRSSRPNLAVLGHVGGTRTYRDLSRNPNASPIEEILILRFDASINFNNAEFIKDFIIHKSEERNKKIRAVIVDAKSINDLDTTAIEALRSVMETLETWNIEFHFAGMKTPVQKLLTRSGLARSLGGTHFHESTHMAVKYLLDKWDRKENIERDEQESEEEAPHRLSDYLKRVDR
ncbi:SulP family inorganic anion transporter [Rhodohalobacter sp. 614A]|uniref:SulP family inorganic anion transporter n=1 Tax=Rhodohalobacter sp. 614A TaxID=2908649 RepID=UPI001F26D7BC|nr:sulfate permease [Rhodohalobacter sp. 614A]